MAKAYIIPAVVACVLILLFAKTPIWRASMITAITILVFILLIDGAAYAKIDYYNKQLLQAGQELKK